MIKLKEEVPIPTEYRWRVVPGVLSGTVKVKLQKKRKLFGWRTVSDRLYGVYEGQYLYDEAIYNLELEMLNSYLRGLSDLKWIKEHSK